MKSVYVLIICFLFLLTGCQAQTKSHNKSSYSNEVINSKKKSSKIEAIEQEIYSFLQDDVQNIGLAYYDLTTKEGFMINGDKQFRSASIAKLFVVMYAYEQLYTRQINKDTLLYYQENFDYEGGSGVLQYENLSLPITLERILEVAIVYSDNIAFHMLFRYFGVEAIMQYYESIIGHETPHDYVYMSAEDTQKLLIKIASEQAFIKMKQDMKQTIYTDRIAKYLPEGSVAHKIGDFETFVHDAAIIESKQAFILVIFSNNLVGAYEKEAEIAKVIYDFNNS